MMEGKVCVVTGANSGIGFATAKALAEKGATVAMVCRNEAKGIAARDQIVAACAHDRVSLHLADMGSQRSVRAVGRELQKQYPDIDILVNNAGTWISDLTYTEDNIETVFAVNHLAYFLLTHLLWPALIAGDGARIINVASDSHHQVKQIDLDDPALSSRYHGLRSYAQSKLANIMFTYEFDRRKPTDKVVINAVQPGLVYTDIGLKHTNWLHAFAWKVRRTLWQGVSPEEGATTSIFLACEPEVCQESGQYWDNCRPKLSSEYSRREEEARRLWELSEQLCGIEQYFAEVPIKKT